MEEKTHPKIEYKQEQMNPHVYQTDNLTEKKINSDNLSIKHNTYSDYTPCYCDLMDCSLPGSSVHRIFQARVLEWGAITFSDYTP